MLGFLFGAIRFGDLSPFTDDHFSQKNDENIESKNQKIDCRLEQNVT